MLCQRLPQARKDQLGASWMMGGSARSRRRDTPISVADSEEPSLGRLAYGLGLLWPNPDLGMKENSEMQNDI